MAGEILAARVRELFAYDPETGEFRRLVRLAQRHHVGDRGDVSINTGPLKGYRRVAFDSVRFLAHRVAWLHVYGEWPVDMIDHINGDKSDNRIANLRQATASLNAQNKRKAQKNCASGLIGAHKHKNGWYAKVYLNKQLAYGKVFKTPEEAHAAYVEAKRTIHPGCTI